MRTIIQNTIAFGIGLFTMYVVMDTNNLIEEHRSLKTKQETEMKDRNLFHSVECDDDSSNNSHSSKERFNPFLIFNPVYL